jgi:hypothetical protein
MPQVFEGRGLEPEQIYIGQMLYDNQQQKIKPIKQTDLYSDDFYRIYDWIWECAQESADHPQIRGIFVDDESWSMINTGKPPKNAPSI